MREILISGYYGFENSGDDALLEAVLCDLKKSAEDAKLVVLSKNPNETSKKYNVESVGRTNLPSLILHLIKAKLLVFGGGTLIQDATSTKSLVYYLALIIMARFFGTKVMLYANGIGPVSEKNRKITTKVLNMVSAITLRDKNSKEELSQLNVTKPYVKLTADPVFTLSSIGDEKGRKLLDAMGISKEEKCIGISIRDFKTTDRDFEDKLACALKNACEKHKLTPVFIVLSPKDREISERVFQKIDIRGFVLCGLSFQQAISLSGCFSLNIGMRLHMLIYSAVSKTPSVGIVYDPKVSGFMEYSGQSRYVFSDNFDKDLFSSHIDYIMENYEECSLEILDISQKMSALSKENAKIASNLFKEGHI